MTMEQFWAWEKVGAVDKAGYLFNRPERWAYFHNWSWLDFGKSMWRKHWGKLQEHVKYIHNGIMKPFRVAILQYPDTVRNMHVLAKYPPPPSIESREYNEAYWSVCETYLSENDIHVATRDRLPTSIQDELENKSQDYRPVSHEE